MIYSMEAFTPPETVGRGKSREIRCWIAVPVDPVLFGAE
jgi:hypothetical protein